MNQIIPISILSKSSEGVDSNGCAESVTLPPLKTRWATATATPRQHLRSRWYCRRGDGGFPGLAPSSEVRMFARDERKLQSPASSWLYPRSRSCKFGKDPKDGTTPVSPVAVR
uniref:Uncharacterized protein n=1 Tax=Oryza glumipatula TaxID=40148 RepID=A0A0D9YP61_9ORYZ